MIAHIVLFKWKGASKEEIEKIFSNLNKLKGKIDGLVDIFSGENLSRYSEGFEYGLVVLVKNRKSLEAYRKHPLHLEIAKQIEKLEEKALAMDFEV